MLARTRCRSTNDTCHNDKANSYFPRNFVVSHNLREMSAGHVREISELHDKASPYHDLLYFAFRQAAEVCRAVTGLQPTAEMLDLALEIDKVPDSTRNRV